MATSEIIVDAPVQNITSKPTHVSESYDVMKLFNFDNLDVTEKLNDACKNKGTRDGIAEYHFHRLAITSADGTNTKTYFVNSDFFKYGGNGIVIGLRENEAKPSNSIPEFIIKIGCVEGKIINDTLKNAIRAKNLFTKFGEEFKDNMALHYGNIVTGDNTIIGTFALYKYLGIEILHFPNLESISSKQKLIKKVIECVQTYQSKFLIHRDVCPENLVYNPETDQVHLIDFDSMEDLSVLRTEDSTVTCKLVDSKIKGHIKICLESSKESCIEIPSFNPRPLTPYMIHIVDHLLKTSKNPIDYLRSFLTTDYYGLFWVIIYILLSPMEMDDIDKKVLQFTLVRKYTENYNNYLRLYMSLCTNKGNKFNKSKLIYSSMSEQYKSYPPLIHFVSLLLELISLSCVDPTFSLQKLLDHEFLHIENIEDTIKSMKENQDAKDKEDLHTLITKIDEISELIRQYNEFKATVRVKVIQDPEYIEKMNIMVSRFNVLNRNPMSQYGGIINSKHKRTNRHINRKIISARHNSQKNPKKR